MIPSSAAAVAEEWTIPLRGVCSAVALSAVQTVSLCGVTAAARPLCRAHAQHHISILIDAERFSRPNSTHTTVVLLPMLPISEIALLVECSQACPVCPSDNSNRLLTLR